MKLKLISTLNLETSVPGFLVSMGFFNRQLLKYLKTFKSVQNLFKLTACSKPYLVSFGRCLFAVNVSDDFTKSSGYVKQTIRL